MKQTICMFVWNHFKNDARVLRECTALTEAGYEVDLIAIHDKNDPNSKRIEQYPEGFTVYRVSNEVKTYAYLARLKKLAKQQKWLLGSIAIIFFILLYFLPLLTIGASVLFIGLTNKYARVIATRSKTFTGMILRSLRKKYDYYHSNDLNTLPQGVLCGKVFRYGKLIYDSHEVQTSRTGYNSKYYGRLERFLLRFIDVMIQENHTRAKYIEELYGFYPKVLHNYPFELIPEKDTTINLHEMLAIPKEEPILLYQGGIQTGRGLDKIVEAVPHMNKGVVVFIGDGKIKPQLEKMVAEKKLQDRVKFLPKVPVRDLYKYTNNAYLGFQVLNNVCFNHYSASSNKLFEYMMSGIPVVACSFPEIQRVVEGENVGVCVDSHVAMSIAAGVNRLLDDEELRNQMATNAYKARHTYNWGNEKEHLLKIYKEVS